MRRFVLLVFVALACTETAECAGISDTSPPGVQALLAPQDTLLGYQSSQPLGGETNGAAMIVRHASPDPSTGNSCELWLVRLTGSSYVMTARNSHVVDCRHNALARNADRMDLASNLTITPNTMTYFNELPRGGTTYGFAWDGTQRAWRLQHVEATWVENGETGVVVYRSVLDYPATLPWLAFEAFAPKAIGDTVRMHRRVVEAPVPANGAEQERRASLRPGYDRCLEASRGVTFAVNSCIGNEYDFQDARLNNAYKALRDTMTDAQRKALRDEERAWIADRDTYCTPRVNGGTADMLDSNACRLDRTAIRAAELEAKRTHP